ncbi:MAG: 50S ribosomal protein L24 [Candidatus Pacebacteria bacterium]|nr:50S ribosomal protein L24 [Candidatus Paceibacterota bacterium]
MKFKVGDKVLVTAGKDKGKKSVITQVLPKKEQVVVKDVNMYVRHVRAVADKPGEKRRLPRPLATAKIAILNDQGEPDRIGYQVDKKGHKTRIYKKTGQVIKNTKKTK